MLHLCLLMLHWLRLVICFFCEDMWEKQVVWAILVSTKLFLDIFNQVSWIRNFFFHNSILERGLANKGIRVKCGAEDETEPLWREYALYKILDKRLIWLIWWMHTSTIHLIVFQKWYYLLKQHSIMYLTPTSSNRPLSVLHPSINHTL